VTPSALAELLRMIKDGIISFGIGKDVFKEMYREGKSARRIVKDRGLIQISNEREIALIVEQVLRETPTMSMNIEEGKGSYSGFS
jgi:aspartyl-tRNA(Asn)/glutamyl-tRNA(Gln) amidotransferase subunit B